MKHRRHSRGRRRRFRLACINAVAAFAFDSGFINRRKEPMLELTRSQLRRLSLEAVGAFSVVMVHGRKKVSRPDQVSGMKDYTLLRPLARIGLVYSYKVERRLMCVPEWQWREYLEKVITQEMFEGKRATH